MIWLSLLLVLVVILVAAEVFTNALEHLGERLGISEGVTGSLFAAIGTAMPETTVPVLAIVAGTDNPALNEQIGVGAIFGAPLMLATLALFVTGLSVLRSRGLKGAIAPEQTGLRRDLNFFLLSFTLAGIGLVLPQAWAYAGLARVALAMTLLLLYFIYALLTVRVSAQLVEQGHATEAHHDMFLCRIGLPDGTATTIVQLALGMTLLLLGAQGFIRVIEQVSMGLGVSALLLSLLIVPVATELPESVNSILWMRRRKDTLAMGNITGAMVFQGSVLPALGLLLTPWQGGPVVFSSIMVTLVAALWLRYASRDGALTVGELAVNGLLYVGYLVVVLA